jgi:hypothetical protein
MFTCITSSTKPGAHWSALTIYKSSPLSLKFTSPNFRYFMDLNELFSSVGGMIFVYSIYAYEKKTMRYA